MVEDAEVRGQEQAPELPYSPDVKRALVMEEQNGMTSESLLQQRNIYVIEEDSEEYEEVCVLATCPGSKA